LPVISWYRLLRSLKDLWAGALWGMGLSPRRAGESLSLALWTRHRPQTALFLSSFRRSRAISVEPGNGRGVSAASASAIVTRQGGDAPPSGGKGDVPARAARRARPERSEEDAPKLIARMIINFQATSAIVLFHAMGSAQLDGVRRHRHARDRQ
jgi:hypothetical protein